MANLEKSNMPKTILIAGATGFIGSYLVEGLLDKNFKVIVLKRSIDDESKIVKFKDKYTYYNSDQTDLSAIFSKNKIDIVINLVTNFGRGASSQSSDIAETNIIYGLKLIEASIAGGVECYFNVDSSLDPQVSLYAYTKRVFREIIEKYHSEKIKVMNLRLEHVFGERDDLFKFIPMAVDKLKKNEPFEMSPGEQKIDLIYVRDCVDAFIYLIEQSSKYREQFNFFEIGTGEAISLKEFILMIREALKSSSTINFGAVPYREHEQMYSQADLTTLAGWKPKYSRKEAIKKMIGQ